MAEREGFSDDGAQDARTCCREGRFRLRSTARCWKDKSYVRQSAVKPLDLRNHSGRTNWTNQIQPHGTYKTR
jgi:hypothetical protein